MTKLFLLLLICLIPAFAWSQSILPGFETLGVDEGLSQNSVYSIYQDKKGFMWFGTADGLNRYDGNNIKVYKVPFANVGNGMPDFIRGNIAEDKSGNTWYSTETGLYMLNHLTDKVELKLLYKQLNNIISFTKNFAIVQIDERERIWLICKPYGILSYEITSKRSSFFPFPFKVDLAKLVGASTAFDNKGKIWYKLYESDGLHCFDTHTQQTKHFFKGKDYWSVGFGKGRHFFAGYGYVEIYDSVTAAITSIPLLDYQNKPVKANSILEDKYGRLWIASNMKGLFLYEPAKKKLVQLHKNDQYKNALSSDNITILSIDRSSNLWIGTDGGGLAKLNLKPSLFNLFPQHQDQYPALKDYFIKSFSEDNNGKIWFGTNADGIGILDPSTGALRTIKIINGERLLNVGVILKDSEGMVWIGHEKGIIVLDPASGKARSISRSAGNAHGNFARKILEYAPGHFFIATANSQHQLVKRNAPGNYSITIISGAHNSWLPADITDIKKLADGKLALVSPYFGLFIVDINKDSILKKQQVLQSLHVRSMHYDTAHPSFLWIGSSAGLVRFNLGSGHTVIFDKKQGIFNEFIYGILPAGKDHLWVSTNGGLSQFDISNERFTNYFNKDGLQSNEFNTGAFYKGPSGNLYFGGIKGFNWFRPADILTRGIQPQVAISSITINEKAVTNDAAYILKSELHLSYQENDLQFDIAALDFTHPVANKIQFQLRGWDPKPIISYNQQVRYSNLPPGNYSLLIKSINSEGIWSDEKKISIFIAAPFWREWWFYAIIATSIITVIIAVTRNMSQQKLKQQIAGLERHQLLEEERKRISREMHDDIGAGLTQITMMSEVAKTKINATAELTEIANTGRQLVNSMSEIIWSLNPENKTLEQLMSYMREQLNQLIEPSGIDYSIILPENGKEVMLTNQQRRNILLITKEIIHNAIKYSKARHISIKGHYDRDVLNMSIQEDGIGFDFSAGTKGNGLKNIRHRVTELGGQLNTCIEGDKMIFEFSVPLKSHLA